MTVHNHGPEEGAGLACNESRLPDGSLLGACQPNGYEAARRLSEAFGTKVTFTPMSSSYQVLCLSHDPATIISELDRDDDMRETLVMGISGHEQCDLLMMRTSGAPVEFGCPGIKNNQCRHGHREMEWADADVVRLLYYVVDDPRDAVQGLFNRYTFKCWTKDRLHRLRYRMGVIEE